MKTSVFFKRLVCVFALISGLSSVNGNFLSPEEYGGISCPNGKAFCPPTNGGTLMGNLNIFNTSSGVRVYYQTNIPSETGKVGSFSSFKKTPSYSSLVYGDYAVAGDSVLKFHGAVGKMDHASSTYENYLQGWKNSKDSKLYLPGDIKPEYIKYARVTWVGSIHNVNFTGKNNIPNYVYGFKCTDNRQMKILKADKKPLSPQFLKAVCKQTYKNGEVIGEKDGKSQLLGYLDCDAIESMVENGVYDPARDNNWRIDLNDYNDPSGYVNYNIGNEKKQSTFFTCDNEEVVALMKKSDLKPISPRVVSGCKKKFPNADCENINGGYKDYYEPIRQYSKPKPIKLDVFEKRNIKLLKEDVEKRKTSLREICKEKFNSSVECNKFPDEVLYKPYTQEELSKDRLNVVSSTSKPTEELKLDFWCISNTNLQGYSADLQYMYQKDASNNRLNKVKQDCKNIKGVDQSLCDKITLESMQKEGVNENTMRFAGVNGDYRFNKIKKEVFNDKVNLECSRTGGNCSLISGRGMQNQMCRLKDVKNQKVAGSTTKDFVCNVHPDKCQEVSSYSKVSFSGGVSGDVETFCKQNPDKCVENVKTCKKWSYGTDMSGYCRKNPDKCVMANFCMGYENNVLNAPNANTNPSDNKSIARLTANYIRDYKKMSLKVGNNDKIDLEADDDDVFYTLSLNNTQHIGGGKGAFWFIYSASADVTQYLKDSIRRTPKGNIRGDAIWELPIVGGNVQTSDGNVLNRATLWHLGREFKAGWETSSFGSYFLTVVYSNDEVSKEMPDKKSKKYEYYKPKNVTIFNGFAALNDPDINRPQGAYLDLDIGGFYTPRQSNYDAKATIYAVANANYFFPGDTFQISYQGNKNDLRKMYNPISKRYNFSGGASIIKPGDSEVSVVDQNMWKSLSINSFILNRFKNSRPDTQFMRAEQTDIHFKYGVKANGRSGEQTYPSVIAFSTDLYVPDVCYYNTVYNKAGKSSRNKGGFVVREGETVKNQVYFTIADNSEAEDVNGLKVKAKLSDNIIYSENTMRIDNSLSETGPNDFIDSKLKYMKDNEKGLYEDEKHTNLIPDSKDKQFNKYDGNYLSFFIGDGAGNVNGNNISGGSLNKNKKDKVYVEYKTKVGGYYEEPAFTYDFSLKGVELNYNISMTKCPTPSGKTEWENVVEVVPLDGVKVVNEDFKKKGDYEGLYTQVANEPFNLKINYDVNVTGRSDDSLSKLLSDKKICILLGYTEQNCNNENFLKEKIGEFSKKRKELNDEIQKLASEINKINENIAKKQSELKIVLKDLDVVNMQIKDLTKRIADLKVAIKQKLDDDNLKIELANLESAKEKAETNKANLETKKRNLDTEISNLEGKLKTIQDNKDNKQSKLENLESGISDEMTRRVGRLDGKFETTLITSGELGDRSVENCKKAKDNKDIHFNHYQDFAIKEKTFKDEATNMDTIMYINKNKGNCADLKTGCFYKSKEVNAFSSFEYFTNDSDKDKIIDMKNIVVGFARPDYTFIVSYLPSGAEILTSCKQECISRYHDEPAATKSSKIEACQNVCIKKHNERIKQGKGEIDEEYLKEYRLDICAGDTFAVRPAYFKLKKELNKDETYNLGGNKLHESFKDSIYPSDKGGNYVLGYDSLLVPDDSNVTANSDPNFTKSAILSTIVPDSCNLDEVKDIVRNADGKSISYSEGNKPIGSNTLWDNTVNASNNLRVDFRSFDKDGKDKNTTERAFYNNTTKTNNISEFQKASNEKIKYANIDLGSLGKLNYYNIGYAKMRLTDSSWTKLDKPYLDKEVKSYSYNKDKDSNKVGAYIGFKDQDLSSIKSIGDSVKNKYLIPEDLVLKFTHDKVMVSVLGIKDKIIKQDPLKTDKIYTYTFFNTEPDNMGASLDLNVTAASSMASVCVDKECLKDKGKYNTLEIYPTLYHKGCYARDIEFGLDFGFDCNKTAGDERCKSLEINPVGDYCDTHSLSSECYKPEAATNKFGKLKHGLVYSSSKKDGNVSISSEVKAEEIDGNNEKKTVIKPGEVAVTVNKEGFDNAKFELPLKFNFKRFPGKNDYINPKLIYADDFIRSNNVAFEEKDLLTDKKIFSSEVLTKGIKAKGRIFKKFNNEILEISDSETKRYNGNKKGNDGNFPTLKNDEFVDINQTSKATFYYGYINAEQKEYEYDESKSVNGVNVDVYSMIYYSGDVNATKATEFAKNNLPIIGDNITKQVNSNERPGFFLNRFEYYNSLSGITSNYFVKLNGYVNDNVEGLTGRRPMQDIKNMYERLTLKVIQPDGKDEIVKVYVSPWFIHNEEDINYNNDFNIFKIIVESKDIANWGGTGQVKDGDIVGRYLYNDGNASKDKIKNLNTLDNAISW